MMEFGRCARGPMALMSVMLFTLCMVAGCGKGTPCWVKGQVTFDGKPVEDGNIVLRPMEKTLGSGAPAKITGGKYEIPKNKGLMVGKYLVLITAEKNGSQYIPDKYNVGSKETVDLGAGANDKDFSLQRGPVTSTRAMKGEEKLVAPPK
jgi:hypothetical protein